MGVSRDFATVRVGVGVQLVGAVVVVVVVVVVFYL